MKKKEYKRLLQNCLYNGSTSVCSLTLVDQTELITDKILQNNTVIYYLESRRTLQT